MCADDLAVITENKQAIHELLVETTEVVKKHGQRMSFEKT